MELRLVFFVVAMVLLKLESTEAYQCYDCRYISTLPNPWQNASCVEPFNATDVPTCEGTLCIAVWANFTSPGRGYILQRTCTNDTNAVTVDQCENLGANSSMKFFLSQNRCCLFTPNTSLPNDSRRYDQMTCGCQTDNCNGNTPYPLMPVTPPAPNNNNGTTGDSNPKMSPCSLLVVSVVMVCTALTRGFINT